MSEIVVNEHDKQKHKLDITFQFPYVGDKLIYKDPNDKSKGYTVKGGKRTKSKRLNLLKKLTDRR